MSSVLHDQNCALISYHPSSSRPGSHVPVEGIPAASFDLERGNTPRSTHPGNPTISEISAAPAAVSRSHALDSGTERGDAPHNSQPGIPTMFPLTSNYYNKKWYYAYVGTIVMVPSLIEYVQIKFPTGSKSPFETHGWFMHMSLVSLFISVVTSGTLFYINDQPEHLDSDVQRLASPIHHTILVSAALFSSIVAALSLLLVLLFPSNLVWIGYPIVGALFVAIATYYFTGKIWLFVKKTPAKTWALINQFKGKARDQLLIGKIWLFVKKTPAKTWVLINQFKGTARNQLPVQITAPQNQ